MGEKNQFLGPDDPISLSLEYYQVHLDDSDEIKTRKPLLQTTTESNTETSKESDSDKTREQTNNNTNCADLNNKVDSIVDKTENSSDNPNDLCVEKDNKDCDKRFLQCPAAVSMTHLQKFIRMKYGLTGDHRVSFHWLFPFLSFESYVILKQTSILLVLSVVMNTAC